MLIISAILFWGHRLKVSLINIQVTPCGNYLHLWTLINFCFNCVSPDLIVLTIFLVSCSMFRQFEIEIYWYKWLITIIRSVDYRLKLKRKEDCWKGHTALHCNGKISVPTLDLELPIPISMSFCSRLLLHLENLMILMMK